MSAFNQKCDQDLDDLAIKNFRDYLKIPSVPPNIDYTDCVNFIKEQAESLDLPVQVVEVHPRKPVVIITWTGTDASLPSIFLNSHMDVVPVYAEHWTNPPFSAHMDEDGNIYARGSQDMKCVGIQYLESIRRLKADGQKFKRTIHITFMPEEEAGGELGMKLFVKTPEFKALNVGFALDEGTANPLDNFYVYYGERTIWHIWIHCTGNTGHGSRLPENTAAEKLQFIISKFLDLRSKEKEKLKDPKLSLGNVTSINLVLIQGGVQNNVVPREIKVAFDVRVDSGKNQKELEDMILQWCKEAGDGVFLEFEQKEPKVEDTVLDDNIFWDTFKGVCDKLKMSLELMIAPGATDMRYIRAHGIPALGFSPMNNTKPLPHDHNEHLNKNIFLKGIKIYMELITALANV